MQKRNEKGGLVRAKRCEERCGKGYRNPKYRNQGILYLEPEGDVLSHQTMGAEALAVEVVAVSVEHAALHLEIS